MIHIEQDILTSKDVCELLKISPVTLWRERRAGRITCRKVSSKVIFLREDVLEYFERIMLPARTSGR